MGKGRSTYYWYLKFTLEWEGLGLGLICLGVKKRKILLTNEIVRDWWFELF